MNLIYSKAYIKVLTFFAALTLCVTFLSNSLLNVAFILFGLCSLFTFNKNIILKNYDILIAVILFFTSGLISNFYNFSELYNISKSFRGLRFFFFAPFMVMAFVHLFENINFKKEKRIRVFNLFLILTSLATLSGLIGLYTGFNYLRLKPVNHMIRNSGMYGMYMTYAYGISLFLTLNIGALFHYKRFQNIVSFPILLTSAIVNLVGLYFSYTRGALLGLFFGLPFIFFKSRQKLMLFFSMILIIFSSFVFLTAPGKELFLSPERKLSSQQRIAFFKGAYFGFLESPIFGLGVKNIEPNMERLKVANKVEDSRSGHSHNIYLEVLANQGAIGFILLMLFFFFGIKSFYQINNGAGMIAVAFMANFCFSGLFQNTFGDSENLQFMILVWSMFSAWIIVNKRSCLKSL